ncbi:MAG: hypothetical protein LLG97_06225 [Deltaproteobacteria bacterium]|nr:hypothetical protein [Deltaproteobacteria bacterium]
MAITWGHVRESDHRCQGGFDSGDGSEHTGYNVGAIFNLNEEHHILFSVGSDIAGDNRFSAYLGYLWTFEPHE